MSATSTLPCMSRRSFVCVAAAGLWCPQLRSEQPQEAEHIHFDVAEFERSRIVQAADAALARPAKALGPIPASVPGLPKQVYYSVNPEWWRADTGDQTYVEHPGRTNPQAFIEHRDALVSMNAEVAACVAAWRLTHGEAYARHAMTLLHTWFLNPETSMKPHLDYAGCRPDVPLGTAQGIEETVMLAETARAAAFLCRYDGIATDEEAADLRSWFSSFAQWLEESKLGLIARESKNRLAICWTVQAAECARFARNDSVRLLCLHQFRDKLLRQMNFDGQFPAELIRQDAYAASIFALDCMATACESLSSPTDRLWDYNLPDGRGLRSGVAFLYPALANRALWKFPADPEHFQELPVQTPSLLLAGRAYSRPEYVATWKALSSREPSTVLARYMPIREPALWTVRAPV